ncbi:MAG: metal-dependent transcriptional regulator [Candidatus Hydrogenedens sp.]|nr:metal-dependent transcriptional regulator [Candidatus Hydrogenedentota bacterium]NLF58217.1 metal-dependent transcriptional regulator [Candidatus Hydrogenedens sp.]
MAARPLTATLEDYLEAIHALAPGNTGARMGDIARRLGVHKSTVTAALRSLAERGLVEYAPYRPVTLTRRGKGIGAEVLRRHDTLRRFLVEVLGVDGGVAEETACKMEHVMPDEVIGRFTSFADFMAACPRVSAHFNRGIGYFCADTPGKGECSRCVAAADTAGGAG